MPTKTFYPRTVTQTTGGKYATFNDLNVIKASGNGYAQTKLIKSKKNSPNRPSTVTCTDFNMQLPLGCTVTKIVVEYKHMKVESGGKYNNIPAPTVSLLYNGKIISVTEKNSEYAGTLKLSKKSKAPTTALDIPYPTWNGKNKYTVNTMKSSTVIGSNGKSTTTKQKTISTTYTMPTRATCNNTTFGVQINYPTNTNTNPGYLRLYWVRIKVDYTLSSYTITTKQTYGGTNHDGSANTNGGYNKDEYRFKATINRKSKTSYSPKVTITIPTGFTYIGMEGTDTVTQVNASTLEWSPKLQTTNSTSSSSIELKFNVNVSYPSGQTRYTGDFELVENLNNASKTHSVTIIDKPPATDIKPAEGTKSISDLLNGGIQYMTVGEEFNVNFVVTEEMYEEICSHYDPYDEPYFEFGAVKQVNFNGQEIDLTHQRVVEWKDNNEGEWWYPYAWFDKVKTYMEDYTTGLTLRVNETGEYKFRINTFSSTDPTNLLYVDIKLAVAPKPEDLTTPNCSLMTLSEEEKNRLSKYDVYTVQSFLKKVTSETFVRNWGNNFRLGVFNNPITENQTTIIYTDEEGEEHELLMDSTNYSTLTEQEIFENAQYWSEPLHNLNEYESVEVQFMYDNEYPLFIIVTGDFPEGDQTQSIHYTEPCIIESDTYKGHEKLGTFPLPIDALVSEEDNTSELQIESMGSSNTFTLCEFPLDDNFGTTDEMAIRGIELTGDIESTDQLVLSAKLCSSTGETGERSIILQDTDTNSIESFSLGGIGDLWGFNLLDIQEFEKWWMELQISNTLTGKEGQINFGDLQIHLYTETVDHQRINCKINGENIAFYGAFITNLNIPPGLETDVSFLNVEGTDINDVYRQNIREKTIEIEFEIGDSCDVETNTNSLRQITRLFTNRRDAYNRPIPNRIEFSHLPDVYYEYIITDSLSVDLDVSTYTVKAKLVIPSGTSFTSNSTTTNVTGYVQGLASINPTITLKPTDSIIQIREKNSGQKFQIGYDGDWIDKILEIDCEDRIVWLKTDDEDDDPTNLNKYVDWNSDWFSLTGEYSFEGSNCVIRTVDYTERW